MNSVPFGSIAEFRNGANYSAGETGPLVRMVGVGDFGVLSRLADFSSIKEIRMSSALSEQDWLKDGDLLFVRSNGNKKLIGRCMLMDIPPDSVAHSGFTIRARVDTTRYLPKFVATIFQTEAIHKQAHLEGTGTNISNLSQQILSEILLPAFDLVQQSEFLNRVNVWSACVDTTAKLLDALQSRKQGLMQQLLTGRRRLKGFSGKWKLLRADKLFTEISVRNQTAKEPLLSVTQDRGVIPRDMLVGRVTMPTGSVDAFKLVEPDNFVISLRSFQGGLEHSAYRGLVSPAYTVLQASDDVHPAFFRHYFKSTDFVKRLSVAVVGIRDGKQISYTDFRSIKLPLPPVHEQIALSGLLDLADQDIALCRARLNSLQLQKRALMQKLLSGEWRFPTALAQTKNTSQIAL